MSIVKFCHINSSSIPTAIIKMAESIDILLLDTLLPKKFPTYIINILKRYSMLDTKNTLQPSILEKIAMGRLFKESVNAKIILSLNPNLGIIFCVSSFFINKLSIK